VREQIIRERGGEGGRERERAYIYSKRPEIISPQAHKVTLRYRFLNCIKNIIN